MTRVDHSELVESARARATGFHGCSTEQALTYACEDVVDNEMPSRHLDLTDVTRTVDHICDAEDLDVPLVEKGRARRAVASADLDAHAICIHRPTVTMLTLLHEIAHLSTRADSHGVLFRDELVRLVRTHIGVEHAALLHGLYGGCGLEISPWAASAHRRGPTG